MQGFNRGYSTIAVSVGSVTAPRYDVAGLLLERLARRLSQREGEPLFLNLNIPNVAPEFVKGIRATRLGGLSYRESVRLEGTDGDAKRYRIARNRPGNQTQAADSDITALKGNYVSITPLKLGMGDDAGVPDVESLGRWFGRFQYLIYAGPNNTMDGYAIGRMTLRTPEVSGARCNMRWTARP